LLAVVAAPRQLRERLAPFALFRTGVPNRWQRWVLFDRRVTLRSRVVFHNCGPSVAGRRTEHRLIPRRRDRQPVPSREPVDEAGFGSDTDIRFAVSATSASRRRRASLGDDETGRTPATRDTGKIYWPIEDWAAASYVVGPTHELRIFVNRI